MKYCRDCGKEIYDTAVICSLCESSQSIEKTGLKHKMVAALLALFLGPFGVHRFYLRQRRGIYYALFCWTLIPFIIAFFDSITFLLLDQQSWDKKYNNGISSGNSSRTANILMAVNVFFVGIFVLGVLAAVTVPHYLDYTARTHFAEGLFLTSPYKTVLTKYYTDNQDFSSFSSSDLKGVTSGKYVNTITVDKASKDTIVLVATFKQSGVSSRIKDKESRLATEDGGLTWACGYAIQNPALVGDTQPNPKYLPESCQEKL